ncbi:MAG: c-type cytochrome [Myxococcota bacterium]
MGMIRRLVVACACLALTTLGTGGAAIAGDLARGEVLFHYCTQCHGDAGGGSQLARAPAIAGLGEWYVLSQLRKFKSGDRGTHPDDIGGLRMHPMSRLLRSEEDVQAVAAYVASLTPSRPKPVVEGGDSARGAALYTLCGTCHGPEGAGNQAFNAPALRTTNDWYLLAALEKYKVGVRGGNLRNGNAVLMRGMAMQLKNEQAMKDVVAHIMTFADAK